jgi:hypothetical protein
MRLYGNSRFDLVVLRGRLSYRRERTRFKRVPVGNRRIPLRTVRHRRSSAYSTEHGSGRRQARHLRGLPVAHTGKGDNLPVLPATDSAE